VSSSEWEEYLVALAPRWLRGPTGEAVLRSFGTQLDALEQGARDAAKCALVERCPEDAIGYHAAARRLELYPGESVTTWRARVAAAWSALHWLGTKKGIEDALKAIGFATAKVHSTADAAPGWWAPAWPPAPRNPKPEWWDASGAPAWPVAHGDTTWWSRFWVVLDAPGPFGWTASTTWGSKNWGGFLWGIDGATEAQVQLVRRVVERWRPAHEVCDGILVNFGGTSAAWIRGTDR
jgi:hypothetical protein